MKKIKVFAFSLLLQTTFAETLFEDDFDDGVIDAAKWTISEPYSDSSIMEQNGFLEVQNRGRAVTNTEFEAPYAVSGRLQLSSVERSNVRIVLRTSGDTLDFAEMSGVAFQAQVRMDHLGYQQQLGLFTINSSDEVIRHVWATTTLALDVWYDFVIVDNGDRVDLFWDGAEAPTLSLPTAYSAGSKIGFYNRSGSAGGSSISHNGIGRLDSFLVQRVAEDSPCCEENSDARTIVNVSTRVTLGPGETVIPGFVVLGENKRILIRAVGPKLADLGVSSPLPNPRMTIYKSRFDGNPADEIASVDDWQENGPDTRFLNSVMESVGAFALAVVEEFQNRSYLTNDTTSAATMVTLSTGVYTVIVSSSNEEESGEVLVEVYEVSEPIPNLPIKWDSGVGANGHYYEFVSDALSWFNADIDANSRSYMDLQGHLLTITTAEEHAFIVKTFPDLKFWIGAFQPNGSPEPDGGWSWVTGENWGFENWRIDEPNNNLGNENHANQFGPQGLWNDGTGSCPLGLPH